MGTDETGVQLREISKDTFRTFCKMQVAESQRALAAPNAVSIAEAYFHRDNAWFRGVYHDETPVGFVMVYDGPVKCQYILWRFMIDEAQQKKGYGKRALELVLDHVRSRPGATELLLSCHRMPGGPEDFYKRFGFEFTGEMWDDERVMRLVL